jgi:hypothetical protein
MTDPDLAECVPQAHWLPFDIDIRTRRVQWLRVDEALVAASNFLDPRMEGQGREMLLTEADPLLALPSPAKPVAWLWHTSFCGSTFAARALHLAPHSVALREPLILRRLADERDVGHDVSQWLAPVASLLARPWHPGGRVVVKPTHAALNLAPGLMDLSPDSRGVVLTSTLEEFLLSHFRKATSTLINIPVLAARALRAGSLASRLPATALQPTDWLTAAALQWAAQQHLIQGLSARFGERVQVVAWRDLRQDPVGTVAAMGRSLHLDLPGDELAAQTGLLARRHAKSSGTDFSSDKLEAENQQLRDQHAQALRDTLRWADTWLMPALD